MLSYRQSEEDESAIAVTVTVHVEDILAPLAGMACYKPKLANKPLALEASGERPGPTGSTMAPLPLLAISDAQAASGTAAEAAGGSDDTLVDQSTLWTARTVHLTFPSPFTRGSVIKAELLQQQGLPVERQLLLFAGGLELLDSQPLSVYVT